MTEPPDIPTRRVDVLPIVLLVTLAGLFLAAWWLFPVLQHFVFWQDCTATGRTNC